ncbi:immunoglobulin superfamily containing leucine-rich repeat protein-like [Ptychodera flava]|uniref:immunoglobulin superfamily containing leucine-rich repeat protein-like n=1 Tax=Ptychodera flava TaxID=63121 RepID=UPI00396A5868
MTAIPTHIPEDVEILDLGYNRIPSLPMEGFSSLSRLKNLHLDAYDNLTTLEELNLQYNNITKLEDFSFSSLSQLKILYLSGNSISVISSEAFHNVTSLEELRLQYNDITTLEAYVFSSLSQMKHLYLHVSQPMPETQPNMIERDGEQGTKSTTMSARAGVMFGVFTGGILFGFGLV